MSITSPQFLIFLSVIFFLFRGTPPSWRWLVILLSSLVFYASFVPLFSLVLLLSISFNYLLGLWMAKTPDDHKRGRLLALGAILNVALLSGFKYLQPIVPLGLSFFTLTAISYLVEVKRKRIPAEPHPGYFACYMAFFPKMVMGPIERPQSFLKQLHENREFNYNQAVSGLRLMLWGYFKKLVVGDRIAMGVDKVYSSPEQFTGPSILMATVLYAFQLYFDFSAYTDIARGAGRILGFDLSRNFDRPYAAASIKEFWTRWHITLSTWLRDYVFLPVAYFFSGKLTQNRYFGIKTEKIIYVLSITITFFLCGIWHGSGWNYIIWGLLFAFYLSIAHLFKVPRDFRKRIPAGLLFRWFNQSIWILLTFLLVCFTWVFFRTNSIPEAFNLLASLGKGWSLFTNPAKIVYDFLLFPGIPNPLELIFTYCLVIFVFSTEYLWFRIGIKQVNSLPVYLRWGGYAMLVFLVLTFGIFGRQFIYAQF
jgi:D-alanyl-lipoteichoic acid acyltransferase DltB (MBOAT superfamily)